MNFFRSSVGYFANVKNCDVRSPTSVTTASKSGKLVADLGDCGLAKHQISGKSRRFLVEIGHAMYVRCRGL